MLYYGTSYNLNFLKEDTIIFNITSLKEGIEKINILPPRSIGHFVDRDFDINYANYLLNDNNAFIGFFTIVYNLYLGKDVYLTMSEEEWSINILQSLCKLIQQRYGYPSMHISDYNDYIYASNNILGDFDHSYGIANLDIDKQRYSYLAEDLRIKNGGKPFSEYDE